MTTTVSNSKMKESTKVFFPEKAGLVPKPKSSSSSPPNDSESNKRTIIFIRHGTSQYNEWKSQPGNRWGSSNFTDDVTLKDSRLSEKGREDARRLNERLSSLSERTTTASDEGGEESAGGSITTFADGNLLSSSRDTILRAHLNSIDMVVTSPLTRAIETFNIGVFSNFLCETKSNGTATNTSTGDESTGIKIIAHPLAAERVVTSSDTGRPIEELCQEFPHIDFESEFPSTTADNDNADDDDDDRSSSTSSSPWWYTHPKNIPHEEWRPCDDGQRYSVPGEPQDRFHERMVQFYDWLRSVQPTDDGRDCEVNDGDGRTTILVVTHFAVIRWFTGEQVGNCEVRVMDLDSVQLK